MVSADPQGILQRVPELSELVSIPSVRRAIERGDAHGLYRALFFARVLGKAKDKGELLAMLLGRRRLFLAPLRGAPSLMTMNGVGATVYGRSDFDINDQTYIKTLFFVVVFVPVFPIAQYLVRDVSDRRWNFIGKVPLGSWLWLWRTGLSLSVVLGILFAIVSALHASRYHQVYVVNGLPFAVRAQLGSLSVMVPPASHESIEMPVGDIKIDVTRPDGRAIDHGSIHVEAGKHLIGWNVLGAAPVMREQVAYAKDAQADARGPEPDVACGVRDFSYDGVDDPFKEPPVKVSIPKDGRPVTRVHVGVIGSGGSDVCLRWLSHKQEFARAEQLSATLAALADYDTASVRVAAGFARRAEGDKAAIDILRVALGKHDGAIELHRMYQELRVEQGERAQVLAEYRARLERKPDDLASQYLVARLEPTNEARALVDALFARAPRDPNVLRMYGHVHMRDPDRTLALTSWQALEKIDAGAYAEAVPSIAECLVSLGRAAEALHVLEREVPRETDLETFERIVTYALVAQLTGADPDKLLHTLPKLAADPTLRTWVRLRSGRLPDPADLARLQPDERTAVDMTLACQVAPADALKQAESANRRALEMLPLEVWALLYAEAARLGPSGEDAALSALRAGSPMGVSVPAAIDQFVRDGTQNADIDQLPSSMRAALAFVRSRNAALSRAERAHIAQGARDEDLLHGIVTRAITAWPQ